jgi:ubiquinone/menaquinone biosynthesis C-methylase UbiE
MIKPMIHQDEDFYYDITEKEYLWKSEEIKEVIRAMEKNGSRKILEIGCGIAGIIPYLPQGTEYIGTDVSELALERARKIHSQSNTKFLIASADALPFQDSTFDFVLSFNVIEHCRKPKTALDEILRVLRPGGGIAITGPNLDFPLSISNGIRHRNSTYKTYIRFLRSLDYIGRMFGYLKFRTIAKNFTEATGRYQKPDDDLRYFCSSYEVIEYLKKQGTSVVYLNKLGGSGWKTKLKKVMALFPGMKYYGRALSVVLVKQ